MIYKVVGSPMRPSADASASLAISMSGVDLDYSSLMQSSGKSKKNNVVQPCEINNLAAIDLS